jgi:hydroxypyruvate reductase 1
MAKEWKVSNHDGKFRVIVTKQLIGERWLKILTDADSRVEYCTSIDVLTKEELIAAFGKRCSGAIGQLAEVWDSEVLTALKSAGGKVYSNVAVGYNNVDVAAATSLGISVGNTPGVLTVTTAELTVALTFAVARRIPEADAFVRSGEFRDWRLDLLLGDILHGKTLGVVGAGRIGAAYARMMVEGHRMNLLYFNLSGNPELEDSLESFNKYLREAGEKPVQFRRTETVEELLEMSDVISLHTSLNESTHHLIGPRCLGMMKKNAILINASRGPVIDESALVEHCRRNPEFRVGLDVFENEPNLAPGLVDLPNVVLLPHIGSATYWTREAMSTLAATNVAGVLKGYELWKSEDMMPFLGDNPPPAVPSLVRK